MTVRALVAVAVLMTTAEGDLLGQSADLTEPLPSTRLACFRPQALPSCRAFVLTEFSLNSEEFGDQNSDADHLQWDLGAMVSVSKTDALGVSLSFGAPDVGHWGGALRYRRWLVENAALEFAPGFVVTGNDISPKRTRITADVSLVLEGWVALFAHGEGDGGNPRVGAGARFASWPGLVTGLLAYGFIGFLGGLE